VAWWVAGGPPPAGAGAVSGDVAVAADNAEPVEDVVTD